MLLLALPANPKTAAITATATQPDSKAAVDSKADIALYEKLAAEKDPVALNNLGWCLLKGIGVAVDEKRGFALINEASELGNPHASMNLVYCLVMAKGIAFNEINLLTAKKLIPKFIMTKNPRAQVIAGIFHLQEGFKTENSAVKVENYNIAVDYFKKSANQRYASGEYYYGFSLEQMDENQKATPWYEKAAKQNHGKALYRLGLTYLRKSKQPKDQETGKSYMLQAVEQKCSQALCWYAQGFIEKGQIDQALLYHLAATDGKWFAPAQCDIGLLYYQKAQELEAIRYFESAALGGYRRAIDCLEKLPWTIKDIAEKSLHSIRLTNINPVPDNRWHEEFHGNLPYLLKTELENYSFPLQKITDKPAETAAAKKISAPATQLTPPTIKPVLTPEEKIAKQQQEEKEKAERAKRHAEKIANDTRQKQIKDQNHKAEQETRAKLLADYIASRKDRYSLWLARKNINEKARYEAQQKARLEAQQAAATKTATTELKQITSAPRLGRARIKSKPIEIKQTYSPPLPAYEYQFPIINSGPLDNTVVAPAVLAPNDNKGWQTQKQKTKTPDAKSTATTATATTPVSDEKTKSQQQIDQDLLTTLAETQYKFAKSFDQLGKQESAAQWYEKAAENGHSDAQAHIAYCYSKGKGVPQNERTAISWYELAAKAGVLSAIHNLAIAHEYGEGGVTQDLSRALELYKRAAEKNYKYSQFGAYNVLFQRGEGYTSEAQEHLKKSAAQGYEQAQLELERLAKEENLDAERNLFPVISETAVMKYPVQIKDEKNDNDSKSSLDTFLATRPLAPQQNKLSFLFKDIKLEQPCAARSDPQQPKQGKLKSAASTPARLLYDNVKTLKPDTKEATQRPEPTTTPRP